MHSAADAKLRAIWLTLMACVSVCLSLAVFFLGALPARSFGLLLLPILSFSALAYAVRWIVHRQGPRNMLHGRLLLFVGGARVVLFLALTLLVLECLIIGIVRPDHRGAMLGTFATGVVAFAILNIALSGVVNTGLTLRKLVRR